MKKLLLIVVALAVVFTVFPVVAKEKEPKGEPSVLCCVKGKCVDMTKDECEEAGGEEVISCKDCKRGSR